VNGLALWRLVVVAVMVVLLFALDTYGASRGLPRVFVTSGELLSFLVGVLAVISKSTKINK
jgi:hypothetical protein